jgi:hypothetical protein
VNLFPAEIHRPRQRSNSVKGEWKDGRNIQVREGSLEPALFAENGVESRGRGARVHAIKIKKHHGLSKESLT